MAETRTPEPVSNDGLQLALLEEINSTKRHDPLAPVTLIVDTSAQGWALRRQLAARLPQGEALANVRCMTVAAFMDHCAKAWTIPTSESTDEIVRVAVTEATLRTEAGLMSASAGHADTAVRLADLVDELAWCPLTETDLGGLASTDASTTARAAAEFVARARTALATALAERAWPDVDARISGLATTGALPTPVLALGTILVAATRVPHPARDVLAILGTELHVAEITPTQLTADQTVHARVRDCPDPSTEAALAVRHVVSEIASGVPPARIAVLYPVSTPYQGLLAEALDDAGLIWHGPGRVSPQATAVARLALCLLEMTSARRETSSGITRPLLMRWLSLGHVHEGEDRVNTAPMRSLIRSEGLYGDARGWRSRLDVLAAPSQSESNGAVLAGDAAVEVADADDADLARQEREQLARQRRAGDAAALVGLIDRLDGALAGITAAGTWGSMGSHLWDAVSQFHLKGAWWQSSESERIAHDSVRGILLDSLPVLDRVVATPAGEVAKPEAAGVALMLVRTLSSRGGRHGTGAIGVHVGLVSSARGLVFDIVVLVGAAEGLLPVVGGSDPLLPDEVRVALRRHPSDLPTSGEQLSAVGADLMGVCTAARTCVITYPRGAIPGRGVNILSRYVTADEQVRVRSARASLVMDPPPASPSDMVLRTGLAAVTPPLELAHVVDAVAAWSSPTFDRYFGHVGPVDGSVAWDLAGQTMSASGIEAYLHCPYHFFVKRVLRFDTDAYADEVDLMSPADMGTMLHRVLERLVAESQERGTLPGYGKPWPAEALADVQRILDEQVAEAAANGLTGWSPAWERSYRQVVESLPDLLDKDADLVRGDPPTQPLAAERRFGPEEGAVADTVDIRLTDDVVVRLRGSIDRVDANETGQRIGIVDYKSGAASGFKSKLGATRGGADGERAKVQDLVYAAAARALYPEATDVDVRFVFVPNRGKGVEVVNADHEPDRSARLVEILEGLQNAGTTGRFPPHRRGRTDYCPVCTRLGRTADRVASHGDVEEEEEQ